MNSHALGIANAHPSFHFQHALFSPRVQIRFHGKMSSVSVAFGDEQSVVPWDWKLLVKAGTSATTTLEPKSVAKEYEMLGSNKGLELGMNPNPPKVLLEHCYGDSEGLDEREKLRRMRISEANKGNTPWNKGRKLSKHSAETLRKIRERTRLAMQSPKVKMKLVNPRHARTTETKQKIAAGVKMRWQRRREKMVVQETCCIEWQNLIAQASREGYVDQKELQWNSYETLDEQFKPESLVSVNQRKQMPRAAGSKRAPRNSEQRNKIAEAISVKLADLENRRRGCSAKAKYHDTEGAERKPRRRSRDVAQSTRRNSVVEKDTANEISVKSGTKILNLISSGNAEFPAFKDHLVSPKPDMIKSIRAQRAAAETKLNKAIERARLLIAEAEKAAKVLEASKTQSPIIRASLIETRKLIAEAIQSLESIDKRGITVSNVPSVALYMANKEEDTEFEVLSQSHTVPINGKKTLSSSDKFSEDPGKCLSNQRMETEQDQSSECKTDPSAVLGIHSIRNETQPESTVVVSKKWVRGRLVEEKQN